jgi:hypothetical protein
MVERQVGTVVKSMFRAWDFALLDFVDRKERTGSIGSSRSKSESSGDGSA